MNLRTQTRGLRVLLLALSMASAAALADPVALAPQIAGSFKAGSGVDAQFLKVHDDWRGSGVLYDPDTDQLGVGQPIGNFRGGSGVWGLVDWRTANLHPGAGMIEASWSGRAAQISFGDEVYNNLHGSTWGWAAPVPLFGAASTPMTQDNWTARFSGFIRITEPGLYNFAVLHDDGFFFDLKGAGAQASMSNDYLNPRNRMSFASGLQLDQGLYGFELGAYEHLEAGVVELSWARDGGDWMRIPSSHLVALGEVTPVPEPASALLLLGGLLLLAATRRRPRCAGHGRTH